MKPPITPCFWFVDDAVGAAARYRQAFGEGTVVSSNPIVATLALFGREIMLINGGAHFRPNPSLSLFVELATDGDVKRAWDELSADGTTLMALDSYPWSSCYGWVQDRYGVSWQLMRSPDGESRVLPALLFVGAQCGRAQEAIDHYTSIFPGSSVSVVNRYDATDPSHAGLVAHARILLAHQPLVVTESAYPHEFAFDEGASLVVGCETQEQIDRYWDALVDGGVESQCGWLKDRFGLSWQIVPTVMGELMSDPDRAKRVTAAFLPMRKLDLATLVSA